MPPTRNPPWRRDELILALDLYMTFRDRLPVHDAPVLIDLSGLLNKIAVGAHEHSESFRNVSSVYMKLANFRSLDDQYTADGRKGLQRGGKEDAAVWNDYAHDLQQLRAAAAGIRAAAQSGERLSRDPYGSEGANAEAPEGELLTRMHTVRERNRNLVRRKKAQVLRQTGELRCEGCEFDFAAYGERGRGFIEVHHLKPVHLLRPGDRTNLLDLAVLCANCHRIVHLARPWLTIDELKQIAPHHRDR